MKRLTDERRQWLLVRARREYRKHRRRERRPTASAVVQTATATVYYPPPPQNAVPPGQYVGRGSRRKIYRFIRPPAVLSLRRNYHGVASFFQYLRHEIYREPDPARLPNGVAFEAIEEVSPSAALVLAAELYRWQNFASRRLVAVRHDRWDPAVSRIFENMGLFDFLRTPNVQNKHSPSDDETVQVIKYRSDTEVISAKCDDLLSHLTEIAGPIHADHFIYDGLVEALKNSKQHAYSEPGEWFGVPAGTWFMSGSYNKAENRLTAAVYDLGIGIPRTLPRANMWEYLRPWLQMGSSDDGQMIAAAMEYGRTRTHLPERGNGLPTMMRILDFHSGYLRIISGTGEATYDSLSREIRAHNHELALGGTLIEWSISK